jgi:uncharacterized cupredoxin-like copper-binding protein
MRLVALGALILVSSATASAALAEVSIEAGANVDGSQYFKPSEFTVDQGDTVRLTVNNVDSIFHDFAIPNYPGTGTAYEWETPPHEIFTREFVAEKAGDIPVICEVKGHKERGMKGVMHVRGKSVPGIDAVLPLGLMVVAGAAVLVSRRVERD